MKRVVLLRHAKSSWDEPDLDDHDRPLARRGRKDARRMAEFLAKCGPKIDYVLCSSALRARQTWAALEKRVEPLHGVVVMRALYLPTQDALRACLAEVPDDVQSLLVIGHNPSLEALALALGTKGAASLRARLTERFPTCSLCVLELSVRSFRELPKAQGRLRALVTPAELAGLKQKAREPVKGAPIELAARPRVVETALQVLESSVTQLRENAEGVRQENAPDFVHQLRVGVRRLRTAIRFFRAALDAPVLDRLLEEAAWLFRSLGPLREYDVFLRDVLGPFAGQRGVAALERAVQDERAALLNDARKALASQRFVHLVRDLLAYQGELSQRKHSLKLRGYARKKLDKRLAQANALRDAVDSKDPVAQHALRKQLKKLRYACEFVCAAFPDRAAQRYLKRLETVQDALGALQDVAVAEHVLAAQLGHLDPRTVRSPLPGKIRALLDERSARATEALARAWRKFERADPFWR